MHGWIHVAANGPSQLCTYGIPTAVPAFDDEDSRQKPACIAGWHGLLAQGFDYSRPDGAQKHRKTQATRHAGWRREHGCAVFPADLEDMDPIWNPMSILNLP